ncbi:MAG: hypothetical protein OXC02_06690 [Rhodobacteraceae bacterium]|nr:hypothetical protein [Paracoccaceae bacterium]
MKETFAGDPTENDLRELSCEDQKSRVQVGEPSSTTPYFPPIDQCPRPNPNQEWSTSSDHQVTLRSDHLEAGKGSQVAHQLLKVDETTTRYHIVFKGKFYLDWKGLFGCRYVYPMV